MLLKAVSSLFLTGLVSCAAVPATILPGKWTTVAPILDYQRQEHSVVTIGESFYVLGGVLPFDGTTYPTVNLVQEYSITTNTWKTVAPMPQALNHANAAVVDGKIYVLGGLAVTATGGPAFWNASGSCSVYDPATNAWTVLDDMPTGRAIGSAAVGVKGTNIYLAGGLLNTNLTNDDEGTTSMFTSYDVSTKKWTVLPDMPAPRDHAGRGLVGNNLYVLGGRAFGHWNVVDTVFSYNIETNHWETGLAPMPTGRGGCASATVGNMIFTFGGEGDPNTVSEVWPQDQAYDVNTNTWKNYTDMDVPRHGTAAVTVGSNIYIPGGGLTIGGDPSNITSYFSACD
jgi:N-acetylneuraminic acid mutarotase